MWELKFVLGKMQTRVIAVEKLTSNPGLSCFYLQVKSMTSFWVRVTENMRRKRKFMCCCYFLRMFKSTWSWAWLIGKCAWLHTRAESEWGFAELKLRCVCGIVWNPWMTDWDINFSQTSHRSGNACTHERSLRVIFYCWTLFILLFYRDF